MDGKRKDLGFLFFVNETDMVYVIINCIICKTGVEGYCDLQRTGREYAKRIS